MNKKKIKQTGEGLVDELGVLLAQIAQLTEQADIIKTSLKSTKYKDVYGEFFKAAIISQQRTVVDWQAIAQYLNPSHQLLSAHTSQKTVVSVKVTSRAAVKDKVTA